MAGITDKEAAALLKSKINLSRTLLTPQVLTSQFSAFVAKYVYSIWHDLPFEQVATGRFKCLPHFIKFTHEILRMTSLPFSVVLLSLKLVKNLKTRRPSLRGAPGSECRLMVCALMLAMKALCDNTYSNRSWEKISGIPLAEINQTEVIQSNAFKVLLRNISHSPPRADGIPRANAV
jgi:hypothetical protein